VTVYRIVQEALTNALRYARQAATLVRLSWEPEQLRVEVLDDGPGKGTAGSDGSGRGLVGMRDRAALVGGRLEAGPRLGGGYAVRAWLPLDGAPGPVPDVA
jgi:signal transduction histidine kinase